MARDTAGWSRQRLCTDRAKLVISAMFRGWVAA